MIASRIVPAASVPKRRGRGKVTLRASAKIDDGRPLSGTDLSTGPLLRPRARRRIERQHAPEETRCR